MSICQTPISQQLINVVIVIYLLRLFSISNTRLISKFLYNSDPFIFDRFVALKIVSVNSLRWILPHTTIQFHRKLLKKENHPNGIQLMLRLYL